MSDLKADNLLPGEAPVARTPVSFLRLFALRTLALLAILLLGSVALKAFLYLSSPHTRAILRGEGRMVEYPVPLGDQTILIRGRLVNAQFRLTFRKWGFFDLYVVVQGDAQPDGQGYRVGGLSTGLSPRQTGDLRFR